MVKSNKANFPTHQFYKWLIELTSAPAVKFVILVLTQIINYNRVPYLGVGTIETHHQDY